MALSTQFLTPPQPRVCPEDGWAEVLLVVRTAAVAIWVPLFADSSLRPESPPIVTEGEWGLPSLASISEVIVSSHSFTHYLGSSSKKLDVTAGWRGWRTLLMKAEEAQTQTILWNALRLDLSNSHFSYRLSFLPYKLSRKTVPCWELMSVQKHLGEMNEKAPCID